MTTPWWLIGRAEHGADALLLQVAIATELSGHLGVGDQDRLAAAQDIAQHGRRQMVAGIQGQTGEDLHRFTRPASGRRQRLAVAQDQEGAGIGTGGLDGHRQQRGQQPVQLDLAGDGLPGLDRRRQVQTLSALRAGIRP